MKFLESIQIWGGRVRSRSLFFAVLGFSGYPQFAYAFAIGAEGALIALVQIFVVSWGVAAVSLILMLLSSKSRSVLIYPLVLLGTLVTPFVVVLFRGGAGNDAIHAYFFALAAPWAFTATCAVAALAESRQKNKRSSNKEQKSVGSEHVSYASKFNVTLPIVLLTFHLFPFAYLFFLLIPSIFRPFNGSPLGTFFEFFFCYFVVTALVIVLVNKSIGWAWINEKSNGARNLLLVGCAIEVPLILYILFARGALSVSPKLFSWMQGFIILSGYALMIYSQRLRKTVHAPNSLPSSDQIQSIKTINRP